MKDLWKIVRALERGKAVKCIETGYTMHLDKIGRLVSRHRSEVSDFFGLRRTYKILRPKKPADAPWPRHQTNATRDIVYVFDAESDGRRVSKSVCRKIGDCWSEGRDGIAVIDITESEAREIAKGLGRNLDGTPYVDPENLYEPVGTPLQVGDVIVPRKEAVSWAIEPNEKYIVESMEDGIARAVGVIGWKRRPWSLSSEKFCRILKRQAPTLEQLRKDAGESPRVGDTMEGPLVSPRTVCHASREFVAYQFTNSGGYGAGSRLEWASWCATATKITRGPVTT